MSELGRVLALDYGEKRIGLALSDPLRIFAKPLMVLPNNGLDSSIAEIRKLLQEHKVSLVLIGMPYAIDGSDTPKTAETKDFAMQMANALSVPVQTYDERYSTCEADAELKKMGYSWQEARKVIDAMAACIFLKEFLLN
ncbi:MAG: Holliday junction resolvase RuvX [Candidatus Cloacimonas sp.]|jgi:putative Holliday junction resolvase|nr:Holliday junction resolvase RuvX [Candidatus Cloacimonas sp.]